MSKTTRKPRPKAPCSEKKKAAQMQKMQKMRNAQRREKYNSDAEYRQRKIAESRESYRKANGFSSKSDTIAQDIKAHGTVRNIRISTDSDKKVLTFSPTELAKVLGLSALTVYRMQADHRLPKPTFKVVVKDSRVTYADPVYILPEVKSLAAILRKHHNEYLHYRKTHTHTMKSIHAELTKIRKAYRNGE